MAYAQAKNDYNWILGYPPNIPEEYFGGVIIDFNYNDVLPKYFSIPCDAAEPAILSSNTGRLLAYSDGCKIYNSDDALMARGDSISYGEIWDNYCYFGYPGTQNHLFLPWPGDTSKALLFHMKIDDDFDTHYLLYSKVEFTKDFPAGVVTDKNKLILNPGTSSLITATRHGNGRDWWLIFPEDQTNRFFSILFDANGVSIVDTQSIGTGWGPREWASQAIFSPDGTKYIRFNPWKGLDIFNFDRCTGQLIDVLESGPLSDPVEIGGGVAVSSDSRRLYVSNNVYLYQFDLWDQDILGSKILIDQYDGYQNPFATTFYQMTLAPDGKIYMFSTNGVKSIHIIKHPKNKGFDCEFIQHGMELPAYVSIGSLNVPYFRLGSQDDSLCDTLGINNKPIADFRYEIDSLNKLQVHFNNLSYFEPETYYWNFGNNSESILENPTEVNYEYEGTFQVCLTVFNKYGEDTFCRDIQLIDSKTTIQYIQSKLITISPNPFANELHISTLIPDLDFRLYSVLGVLMFEQELFQKETYIKLPDLPIGLYFYSLTSKNQLLQSDCIVKE